MENEIKVVELFAGVGGFREVTSKFFITRKKLIYGLSKRS